MFKHCFFLLLVCCSVAVSAAEKRLQVGITLHPYYSYVANIVQDKADIIPLVDAGFNPHSYELQPADLARLINMDILILNGIGHDEFAVKAVESMKPQLDNRQTPLTVVYANKDVPLLTAANSNQAWNPHTFVSINSAIRQIYTIAEEIGKMDTENAAFYKKNAVSYARKLRKLKHHFTKSLLSANLKNVKIASTHNAYGYFLQEFGIGIDTVIEPAHGVEPSASQLQSTIDRIKAANINLMFTELNMGNRYVTTIEKATGIKLYHFSHMTHGEYDADMVYREMKSNLETLISALNSPTKNALLLNQTKAEHE